MKKKAIKGRATVRSASSLAGFVDVIQNLEPEAGEELAYRGHADHQYQLTPYVFRERKFKDKEELMLRELVASYQSDFSNDTSTLEQLARAQHYSLPTRLLDITWNPLVALYFATLEENDNIGGDVIVFKIRKGNTKFYDSDTVSCLSNLAHLSSQEKQDLKRTVKEAPIKEKFNQDETIKRLLHFIKVEKPYFLPKIVPNDLNKIICAKPKKNNLRIIAQSGAFLVFSLKETLDDDSIEDGISVEKIRIEPRNKKKIRLQLDKIGINNSTMFPEIDKAAQYIRNKVLL